MTDTDSSNLNTRLQKQKKKNRKIHFYHSFLTIVLVLIILQISYSAVINFAKIVSYQGKIAKAQELYNQADSRNKQLKSEIKNFSSMYKVEAIARNNLKMAAKDEVLIIINQPSEEENEDKTFNSKILNFFEDLAEKFNKNNTPDKTSSDLFDHSQS